MMKDRTDSAIMSIHLCFAWIPIGIFAACFLIFRFYNLDNEFEGILADLQSCTAKKN